jgi:hypothetical protein
VIKKIFVSLSKEINDMKKDKLIRDKEGRYNYLFNWIGGGFNSVWAFNVQEARNIVKKEREESAKNYPTHVKLVADPKSFRKATREMSDEQNKMGWMMTM